jgi:hypothetical protein
LCKYHIAPLELVDYNIEYYQSENNIAIVCRRCVKLLNEIKQASDLTKYSIADYRALIPGLREFLIENQDGKSKATYT